MTFKQKVRAFAKKFKIARVLWHFYQKVIYKIKHPFALYNKKNRNGFVIQMLSTFSEKDAIGNSAIEISKALNERRLRNYIVYEGANSKIKNGVPISLFAFNEKDIVIFHMGIGCKAADYFKNINVKTKVMIYHNITPKEYFYDLPNDQKAIIRGRRQLSDLKHVTDLAICVSKFNESELIKLGYRKTCVVPVPHKIDDLLKYKIVKKDSAFTNIITVGRIARHKCIEDVIKTFKEYHLLDKKSKLFIIGSCGNLKYENELKKIIANLHLFDCVFFAGSVSDEELAQFYKDASAYLCMSEHEGFCIPLIESLMFNVPTFAYKCSAVGETLGEFGYLFKDKNYKKNSKIMYDILHNKKQILSNNNFIKIYNAKYNNKTNVNKIVDLSVNQRN